jgi:hypothetical protein
VARRPNSFIASSRVVFSRLSVKVSRSREAGTRISESVASRNSSGDLPQLEIAGVEADLL